MSLLVKCSRRYFRLNVPKACLYIISTLDNRWNNHISPYAASSSYIPIVSRIMLRTFISLLLEYSCRQYRLNEPEACLYIISTRDYRWNDQISPCAAAAAGTSYMMHIMSIILLRRMDVAASQVQPSPVSNECAWAY